MAVIEEIRRLRAEGWPPIAEINGPTCHDYTYAVTFADARGEIVGDLFQLSVQSQAEAVAMVERARSQMKC
jgi:hypothetical protein